MAYAIHIVIYTLVDIDFTCVFVSQNNKTHSHSWPKCVRLLFCFIIKECTNKIVLISENCVVQFIYDLSTYCALKLRNLFLEINK